MRIQGNSFRLERKKPRSFANQKRVQKVGKQMGTFFAQGYANNLAGTQGKGNHVRVTPFSNC